MRCGHLCSQKKSIWISYVFDTSTGRVLSGIVGDRGIKDLKRLWEKVEKIKMTFVCTDNGKPYQKIISPDIHLKTKKLTHWIESMNSKLRLFLHA